MRDFRLFGPSPEEELLMRSRALRGATQDYVPRETPAEPAEMESFGMALAMSGDPMMMPAGQMQVRAAEAERGRLQRAKAAELAFKNAQARASSRGGLTDRYIMDRQRKLAQDLKDSPQALDTINNIKAEMSQYVDWSSPEGPVILEGIPGIGIGSQLQFGAEARRLKRLGDKLVAQVLNKLSGTAASEKEYERLRNLLGRGLFSTEQEFVDAVADLEGLARDEVNLARQGYDDFELQLFDAKSGRQAPQQQQQQQEDTPNVVLKAEDYF